MVPPATTRPLLSPRAFAYRSSLLPMGCPEQYSGGQLLKLTWEHLLLEDGNNSSEYLCEYERKKIYETALAFACVRIICGFGP
jgi:hypothetical protein